MPAIKVADFAFPRMEAPDLDQMEEFLTHFGLVRAERTPDVLYMRGADDHHHLHVTHKGGTKFIGFAYHAADESYWTNIYFWNTPQANCGDDRGDVCKTSEDWRSAWTEIKG